MKKFAIIILFLLGLTQQLWAQNLTDQLVEDLCDCVSKEVSEDADAETIKMELGLCMLNITSGKTKEIEAEMGIDLSSPDGFREFGEQIGGVLALKCEKFVELLFQAKEGESSLADEALRDQEEVSRKSSQKFIGKVITLSGEEILVLTVAGEAGEEEFFCLEEFNGVGVLKFKKDLINKEVIIEYISRNLFNPETFEFETKKVLSSITLK